MRFNWAYIWSVVWRKAVKYGLILAAFILFHELFLGCTSISQKKEIKKAETEQEIKIKQYVPDAKTQTEKEAVDQLTRRYKREPEMYVYSFPIKIENEIKQIEQLVYFWQISETHYVELVIVNGVVMGKNTKEIKRVFKTP